MRRLGSPRIRALWSRQLVRIGRAMKAGDAVSTRHYAAGDLIGKSLNHPTIPALDAPYFA